MNQIGRVIQLDSSQIRNRRTFRLAFDQVMDYPGWYNRNLDEWIDLISVHEQMGGRFDTSHNEIFILEVVGADQLAENFPKPFLSMIEMVNRVNKRYMEKVGKSILALVLA